MNKITKNFHKIADFLKSNAKTRGVSSTFHKVNYKLDIVYIIKTKEVSNTCEITTIDGKKLFDSERSLKDYVAQHSYFAYTDNETVVNHTMIDSISDNGFVVRIKNKKFIVSRFYRPILLQKIEDNL